MRHTRKAALRSREDADRREFARLYQESYELVYNYVRYRMASDEAEDVVSEAYLLAARNFHRFDPTRAKFSTWVIHIAINCMNSHWRRVRTTVDLEQVPEGAFAVESTEGSVDDRALVDTLLDVLDEREREMVLMKYREDMRNADIARALDMNASTVSTILSRALAKMRVVAERST